MVCTRREILVLWKAIEAVTASDQPIKFAYALARNRSKLRRVVQDIRDAAKPLDEYEQARIALAREMARKGADNKPIVNPATQMYLIADMAAFDERLKTLKAETGQDKREREIEELLDGEETIRVYTVTADALPDSIRPDVLEGLLPMIEEAE